MLLHPQKVQKSRCASPAASTKAPVSISSRRRNGILILFLLHPVYIPGWQVHPVCIPAWYKIAAAHFPEDCSWDDLRGVVPLLRETSWWSLEGFMSGVGV